MRPCFLQVGAAITSAALLQSRSASPVASTLLEGKGQGSCFLHPLDPLLQPARSSRPVEAHHQSVREEKGVLQCEHYQQFYLLYLRLPSLLPTARQRIAALLLEESTPCLLHMLKLRLTSLPRWDLWLLLGASLISQVLYGPASSQAGSTFSMTSLSSSLHLLQAFCSPWGISQHKPNCHCGHSAALHESRCGCWGDNFSGGVFCLNPSPPPNWNAKVQRREQNEWEAIAGKEQLRTRGSSHQGAKFCSWYCTLFPVFLGISSHLIYGLDSCQITRRTHPCLCRQLREAQAPEWWGLQPSLCCSLLPSYYCWDLGAIY